MELKRLIINGFKSFADKTEIDFVSGLTGIVGPNGSGKVTSPRRFAGRWVNRVPRVCEANEWVMLSLQVRIVGLL